MKKRDQYTEIHGYAGMTLEHAVRLLKTYHEDGKKSSYVLTRRISIQTK